MERSIYYPPAYELEAQAIVVAEAQRNNKLQIQKMHFVGLETVVEDQLEWYIIWSDPITETGVPIFGATHQISLLSNNCDEKLLLQELKLGDSLTLIQTSYRREDITSSGTPSDIIAAIFARGNLLYKSPGFDLNSYRMPTL